MLGQREFQGTKMSAQERFWRRSGINFEKNEMGWEHEKQIPGKSHKRMSLNKPYKRMQNWRESLAQVFAVFFFFHLIFYLVLFNFHILKTSLDSLLPSNTLID